MALRRDARGVSDIIGTIILLAITIILVGVAALAFTSTSSTATDLPPRLDVAAFAGHGDTTVTLTHTGGATFEASGLEIVLTVDEVVKYRGPISALTTSGTWALGDRVVVPLDSGSYTLAAGDRVDILVVSLTHTATVATASLVVPDPMAASAAAGSATIDLKFSGGNPDRLDPVYPGSVFFLTAEVTHPEGRKAILAVTTNHEEIRGPSVLPLYDDGTHGDQTPGDMFYSGYFVVPVDVTPGDPLHVVGTVTAIDGSTSTDQVEMNVLPIPEPEAYGTPTIISVTPERGTSETVVTITGTELSYVNRVTLKAVTPPYTEYVATFGALSDTELQFVPTEAIPPGEYQIRVSNPQFISTPYCSLSGSPPCFIIDPTPPGPPQFNTELIDAFGYHIAKSSGGGGNNGDRITAHLKVRFVHPTFVGGSTMPGGGTFPGTSGKTYEIEEAWIDWVPLGTSTAPSEAQMNDGTSGGNPYVCYEPETKVAAWLIDAERIPDYKRNRDDFNFLLYVRWVASSNDVYEEYVDVESSSQFFQLKRLQEDDELRVDGFPDDLTDGECDAE